MPVIYKFCDTCGSRYGTFRSQRKHCSNACRQRAYRNAHTTVQPDATTLTLKIGPMILTVTGLEPDRNKDQLRQRIIDALGPNLIEKVSSLPTAQTIKPTEDTIMPQQEDRIVDPAYETRVPVLIIYTDGWQQQTNAGRSELADIVGSQRLVGNTLRTVAEVR